VSCVTTDQEEASKKSQNRLVAPHQQWQPSQDLPSETAMCANVERRPSVSIVPKHRRSMDGGVPLEPRPHTRVDDESAIEKKYSFGEVLGQGSFGVVREVTNRLTGQQFAMKIVNKEKVSKNIIRWSFILARLPKKYALF